MRRVVICFGVLFLGRKIVFDGQRTLIMGILNVTPDSFSDGGRFVSPSAAKERVVEMIEEGADVIDVGAESTRPGAVPIEEDTEIKRLLPILEAVLPVCSVPVSVDTYHAKVADAALYLGSDIVNDVWGLSYAGEARGSMAEVVAKYDAQVIVMHNSLVAAYPKGLLREIREFFDKSINLAKEKGVPKENIILDPGLGFAKDTGENLFVIKRLSELKDIGGQSYPLLIGPSRKRFIGDILSLPAKERDKGTGAACVAAALLGADMVRVHDVKSAAMMCRVADAIRNCGEL